jgi:hypothetical protein
MAPSLSVLAGERPAAAPAGPSRRRVMLAVALVASWALPAVTHPLRVDWLLPPLLLVATAALLRTGRTLLDRLICAVVLLFAGTCAAGLLLSVWPWHLHPVAVAGLGFTILTGLAALTGRRPVLPWRRYRPADLITLGYTGLAAAVALYPLLRRDLAGRLAMFMHVEDFSRHLMIYDTIRVEGGYLFLHKADAITHTYEPGFLSYPQGSHFVGALLENFAESSATPGNPLTWAGNFIWWHLAGFVMMCLAVLWAAQRVAGPAVRPWLAVALGGLVTGYLLFGDPITIYSRGYPQEVGCLVLVAVLTALAIRPLPGEREQIVLIGALLAAISFTYYLFLPVAVVIVAGWLVAHRRRILPRWRFTLGVALVSGALALVIPLENRAADPGTVLLQSGQAVSVNTAPLWVIGLACAVALALLTLRRRIAGPVGLVALLTVAGFSIAVDRYQMSNHGNPYFWFKALHESIIVVLVCSGALAAALRPPPKLVRDPRWRLAAPAVAAVVILAAFGYFGSGSATTMSQGRFYLSGRISEKIAAGRDTLAVYQWYPQPDGKTIVVLKDGPWPSFLATLYVGILHHRYAPAEDFAQHIRPWTGTHPLPEVEGYLAANSRPVRVISDDPGMLTELRRFATTLPAGQLEVVDARQKS